MRRLEIPVPFHLNAVKKRGSVSRSNSLYLMVGVSFNFVESNDAPVAAIIKTDRHSPYASSQGKSEIRFYEGKLYGKVATEYYDSREGVSSYEDVTYEMLDNFINSSTRDESHQEVSRVLPSGAGIARDVLHGAAYNHYEPPRLFSTEDWKEYDPSAIEKAKEKALALYEDLIVVNGVFWKVVDEPVYVVKPSGLMNSNHGNPKYYLEIGQSADSVEPQYKFNLNNWDDVVEQIDRKYDGEIGENQLVDVLLPDAFGYNDLDIKVIDLLRQVKVISGDKLYEKPVEYMIDWANLRDLWLDYHTKEPSGEIVIDDLLEAAERLLQKHKLDPRAVGSIEKAVGFWGNKPISVGQSMKM